MAEAEVKINNCEAVPPKDKVIVGDFPTSERQARRWNDYGIALLEQSQYGAAAEAFRRANALAPKDPNPLVSAAIAEMSTERFGPDRDQLRKSAELLDAALPIEPANPRARLLRALVLRSEGRPPD